MAEGVAFSAETEAKCQSCWQNPMTANSVLLPPHCGETTSQVISQRTMKKNAELLMVTFSVNLAINKQTVDTSLIFNKYMCSIHNCSWILFLVSFATQVHEAWVPACIPTHPLWYICKVEIYNVKIYEVYNYMVHEWLYALMQWYDINIMTSNMYDYTRIGPRRLDMYMQESVLENFLVHCGLNQMSTLSQLLFKCIFMNEMFCDGIEIWLQFVQVVNKSAFL